MSHTTNNPRPDLTAHRMTKPVIGRYDFLRLPICLLAAATLILGVKGYTVYRGNKLRMAYESESSSGAPDASVSLPSMVDEFLYLKSSARAEKKNGDDTSARAIYQILHDLEGISHRTGSHPEEMSPELSKKNRASYSSTKMGRGGKEIIVVRQNSAKLVETKPVSTTPMPKKLSLEEVLTTLSRTPLGNPADAPLSSLFGWRVSPFHQEEKSSFHSGLDYSVGKFSPVWATADGIVTEAGSCGAYGNCIIVDHGNGYETLYAHLSRFNVVQGASVCRSQAIGQIGSTGRSTGPHLHYEIHKNGVPINPMPFVEAAKLLSIILGEILL